jgi:hypothetical protein
MLDLPAFATHGPGGPRTAVQVLRKKPAKYFPLPCVNGL